MKFRSQSRQCPHKFSTTIAMADTIRIAIIGSGISGLSCARNLLEKSPKGSVSLTIFEKSKGPSGRCSTRRFPLVHRKNDESIKFDHGAQYFTVSAPEFKKQFQIWKDNGIVEEWKGRIVALEDGKIEEKKDGPPRYVGVQGMSSLGKDLANGLDVKNSTRITKLERNEKSSTWSLQSESGETFGLFDWVVLTAPSPQTAQLLNGIDAEMEKKANQVNFKPSWAFMMAFEEGVKTGLDYDGAFVNKDPTFSWISKNSSKPGRKDECESWVLHCNADFSRENLEATPEEIKGKILESFYNTTGVSKEKVPFHQLAFKWRFAQPEPIEDPFLMNPKLKIGACGDWCKTSKVEGAYMSGYNMGLTIFQQEFPSHPRL